MGSLARTSLAVFAFLTTASSICVFAFGYLFSMPLLADQIFEKTLCSYVANASNGFNGCQCKWDFLDDDLLLCFSEYPCINLEVEYYVQSEDRIVASHMEKTAGTTYELSETQDCFMKPAPCKEQRSANIRSVTHSVSRYTTGERFPCFYFTNRPLDIYAEDPSSSAPLLGIFMPFIIPAVCEGVFMMLMLISALFVVCQKCKPCSDQCRS